MKKLIITKAQLKAIVNLRDDIEAMIGCGCASIDDDGFNADDNWSKKVKTVDRFLLKNNIDSNDYR